MRRGLSDCKLPGLSARRLVPLLLLLGEVILSGAVSPAYAAGGDRIPSGIARQVETAGEADVLVVLDDSDARALALQMRQRLHIPNDNAAVVAAKARIFSRDKSAVLSELSSRGYTLLTDYHNFPVMYVRVDGKTLDRLAAMAAVASISENREVKPVYTDSQTLIGIPQAWTFSTGQTGAGTSVAVLDTGIDYSGSGLTACTTAGETGCIAYEYCFATGGCQSDHSHGTNVSGVVLQVAPDVKVLALDVFRTSGSAYYSDILSAMDWVMTNRSVYNITAVNLSLGGSTGYTSPCAGDGLESTISNMKAAGVATVVAAGNSAFADALTAPACDPDAISVGAVYANSYGSLSWCTDSSCSSILCTDSTTSADQVTCFSDSASFLSILAPGSIITAAGVTMSGTSQATPHVAGAVALLQSESPGLTVDQVLGYLTVSGKPITDSKNGITKPRLDLYAAVTQAAPVSYSLTVSKSGSGSGTVTSSPAGINCGTSCQTPFAEGTTVTLTASAGTGSAFTGWSGGGCSGTGACVVTLNADTTVTAGFNASVIPPTADFSGTPLSGTAPLAVAFTDSSANSPASWSWTFGDGGTSTLQNPSHTYQNGGTYSVSLTAANAGGSDTKTVTNYITVTCPAFPVRIARATPLYFSSLQTGYGAASNGDIIQMQDTTLTEAPDLNNGTTVTLSGGYDPCYTTNSGTYTTINGSLTISTGTATIEDIIIK